MKPDPKKVIIKHPIMIYEHHSEEKPVVRLKTTLVAGLMAATFMAIVFITWLIRNWFGV